MRGVLRARGVADQDVDDMAQVTFLEACRAPRLPEEEQTGRRYVHGIARRTAIDLAARKKTDPIEITLHCRAEDDKQAEDDEEALAGGVRGRDRLLPCALERVADPGPSGDTVYLARKVVEEALEQFPEPFSMFWRTQVVVETASEVASARASRLDASARWSRRRAKCCARSSPDAAPRSSPSSWPSR
ncbi:MAG: sigma-70 family RNA polymerase sigma factor [Myxococcales bacterium]|nr:sigma-70 family RNA polymerase sigma factor [Myxococcales bacterium]